MSLSTALLPPWQSSLRPLTGTLILSCRSANERILTSACILTMPHRSANGVLVSDVKGRDIKIDSYSLSYHGRLLIEGAEISLNYGQRYGLLGENGSGKSTFLKSIAERDVEIPEHIDVRICRASTATSRSTH